MVLLSTAFPAAALGGESSLAFEGMGWWDGWETKAWGC